MSIHTCYESHPGSLWCYHSIPAASYILLQELDIFFLQWPQTFKIMNLSSREQSVRTPVSCRSCSGGCRKAFLMWTFSVRSIFFLELAAHQQRCQSLTGCMQQCISNSSEMCSSASQAPVDAPHCNFMAPGWIPKDFLIKLENIEEQQSTGETTMTTKVMLCMHRKRLGE